MRELAEDNKGIAPYMFEGRLDGVRVDLAVGFYSPFSLDPDEEPVKGKAEEAGWTIICNDRVVVYKDKTILTGWGDGAPHYHPQFRQIAGVVIFSSNDPRSLPLTTTKRGIEPQARIYLEIRKKMRDGLARFTSFTNSLKKISDTERDEVFRRTSNIELRQLQSAREKLKAELWIRDRSGEGRTFDPPLPKLVESTERRMVFSRPIEQIRKVSRYLFDDPDLPPKDVAAEAFDQTLERAKRKK